MDGNAVPYGMLRSQKITEDNKVIMEVVKMRYLLKSMLGHPDESYFKNFVSEL
jgi:hypothetical protein